MSYLHINISITIVNKNITKIKKKRENWDIIIPENILAMETYLGVVLRTVGKVY
jgi:hypothetical protein